MSKKDKLIQKLKSKSKDFTYEELKTLLNYLGFYENNKGRTSGSRVEFIREGHKKIQLHKPHPRNVLKPYQIEILLNELEELEVI